MTTAPTLLDAEGRASMATLLMIIHHGLRRDARRLAKAIANHDAAALREGWSMFHQTLHGHHEAEDARMLPGLRAASPALGPVLDELAREHAAMDPMLAKVESALADLASPDARGRAGALVEELGAMLERHLAKEEEHLVPLLRGLAAPPQPVSTDEEATGVAAALAWSEDGVAPDIIALAYAAVPPLVAEKLPAARAAYAQKRQRAWNEPARGATRTCLPETT